MLYVFSFRTLLVATWVFVLTTSLPSYSLTPAPPQLQNVTSGVQSYREWKNQKVYDAQMKIKNIKDKIGIDPNLSASKGGSSEAGLSRELERETLNLSLTQDLTISDYFVGYLTRQASMDSAIKDVSLRLSSDEVAELMSAFADKLYQAKPTSPKASSAADFNQ